MAGREDGRRVRLFAAGKAEAAAGGRGTILADSSRMAEAAAHRPGSWHDALGHHLNGLSLNSKAALQLNTGGGGKGQCRDGAKPLARRLLSDVSGDSAQSRGARTG